MARHSILGEGCIRYTLAALALSQGVLGAFSAGSTTDFVVYWGQNSAGNTGGPAQKSLVEYCADPNFDVINLAFLEQITPPSLNFYGQSDYCSTTATGTSTGTTLESCTDIANDIVTCQSNYSTSILLSIGGATYSGGGFSTSDVAVAAAQNIWAAFGPPQANSTTGAALSRPFGAASVNGFDLDIESSASNMVSFANELRSLMDGAPATNNASTTRRARTMYSASSTNSKYYLTAAPQCPYPDAWNSEMLNGAVSFDAVSVQFYNNACGLQSFTLGSLPTNSSNANATTTPQTSSPSSQFNFEQWDTWASTVSKNPNVRVLLGVPGSATAASSGYTSASGVADIIQYCKQFKSFGGVMAWDASQVEANTGFAAGVRQSLTMVSSRVRHALRPRRYEWRR